MVPTLRIYDTYEDIYDAYDMTAVTCKHQQLFRWDRCYLWQKIPLCWEAHDREVYSMHRRQLLPVQL